MKIKHLFLIAASLILATSLASAQTYDSTETAISAPSTSDSTPNLDTTQTISPEIIWPHSLIGIRGGLNLADMVYSHKPIERYKHFWQPQGMLGLFFHFQLGESGFSLRPEVSVIGRADSLKWKDVEYRLKAHYLDFRLPIVYNFRFDNSRVSPYIMVVPEFGMAYGGKVSYHADDFPNGVKAPITQADINDYDAGVMFGLGIDFLIKTSGMPLLFSIEGGYNIGLLNNFAQREILNNPDVAQGSRSIIANNFFGAELYQETRRSRGIEVAMRLALPIDGSWKKKPEPQKPIDIPTVKDPDTVYVVVIDTTPVKPDTVYIPTGTTTTIHDSTEYIKKDCYSFAEMYAFITLGIDISDKRICLFNINFDFDSYRLREESKQPLSEVAMMMKAYPEMRIKVFGHTDSIGSDTYNNNLSLQRANSVIKYLKSLGIDGNRMEPEGYGEQYPIDTNDTEEGRFRNRRVEIEVLNVGMRITDNNKEDKENNN